MSQERFVSFYLAAMLANATSKRVQRVEYLRAELAKEIHITVVLDDGERMKMICEENAALIAIARDVTARVAAKLGGEEA